MSTFREVWRVVAESPLYPKSFRDPPPAKTWWEGDPAPPNQPASTHPHPPGPAHLDPAPGPQPRLRAPAPLPPKQQTNKHNFFLMKRKQTPAVRLTSGAADFRARESRGSGVSAAVHPRARWGMHTPRTGTPRDAQHPGGRSLREQQRSPGAEKWPAREGGRVRTRGAEEGRGFGVSVRVCVSDTRGPGAQGPRGRKRGASAAGPGRGRLAQRPRSLHREAAFLDD